MKPVGPEEIEERSFSIITKELQEMKKRLPEEYAFLIKRVIHTTADFSYADTLYFSEGVLQKAEEALQKGVTIVTDTNMAKAGINQNVLSKKGGRLCCFMAKEDVAEEAKRRGQTRAFVSAERAAMLTEDWIYVVGNAPTGLLRLLELWQEGKLKNPPVFIIGVPVGFVNVVEAKNALISSGLSCIVNRGRKGGSNVAAGIVNALLYHTLVR